MLKDLLNRAYRLSRTGEEQDPSGVEGLPGAVALFELGYLDVHRSRVCEAGGCVAALDAAYRTMWRECCRA